MFLKITIRGVDSELWRQVKHDCVDERKTQGQIVNEALRLRQERKAKKN